MFFSDYKFDFQDSIKWSSNDIAIVKVDKPFKLGVCEKGCEFPTDLICYNNVSRELEKPGTKGYIAGWGSGNNFREVCAFFGFICFEIYSYFLLHVTCIK